MRTVAIVGTGTGIGKTHLGVALVRALAARGHRVAGRKPIESGVDGTGPTDGQQLELAGNVPSTSPPPFLFVDPVSPHLAARRACRTVDVGVAARWCRTSSPGASHLVVETAGGLFSPLGRDLRNLELVATLAPDHVILVAPDRLGVLHDVAAVCAGVAASFRGRVLLVLAAPPVADASTGSNADELVWLGLAGRVGSWGRDAAGPEADAILELLATPPILGQGFT